MKEQLVRVVDGVTLFDTPLDVFWNFWVIGIITINLGLLLWLILWTQKIPAGDAQSENDDTGHVFDGIREMNNPLPKWWLYMLYLTMVFAVAYLALFPGYGNVVGTLGWTQESQLHEEQAAMDKKTAPVFARLTAMSIEEIAKDKQGHKIGKRLFINYCSVCHGTTGAGAKDFPNLTDNNWLYGGKPEQIQASILAGRGGVMPPYGGVPLDNTKLNNVANYVLSLSGRKHDVVKAEKGKANFAICAACHGQKGEGNQALGAPKLNDSIWLHGRSIAHIKSNIKHGFDGQKNRMPAFKSFLGEDKVKVLAAYVYSLSE